MMSILPDIYQRHERQKRYTLRSNALLSDASEILELFESNSRPCRFEPEDYCIAHGEPRYCKFEKLRKWQAEYAKLDAEES